MAFRAATLERVYAAVPAARGARPVEISRAIGDLSVVTVRHALRALVEAGRVTFDGPDCRRLYRRVAAARARRSAMKRPTIVQREWLRTADAIEGTLHARWPVSGIAVDRRMIERVVEQDWARPYGDGWCITPAGRLVGGAQVRRRDFGGKGKR